MLDRDARAGLLGQLGWSPAVYASGGAHRPGEVGGEGDRRVPPTAGVDSEAARSRIAVDITFYSSQIKKNLLQHHGVRD